VLVLLRVSLRLWQYWDGLWTVDTKVFEAVCPSWEIRAG
jgi:hypothetical protein